MVIKEEANRQSPPSAVAPPLQRPSSPSTESYAVSFKDSGACQVHVIPERVPCKPSLHIRISAMQHRGLYVGIIKSHNFKCYVSKK